MRYNRMLLGGLAAIMVAGCHKSGGGDNIAMVGPDPITKDAFYTHLVTKMRFSGRAVGGANNLVEVVPGPGYQALQEMIVSDLWLQLAKDQGVLPSSGDVDKELTFQLDLKPHLLDDALHLGISKQQILDDLKADLSKFRLQTKGVTVTPDEVDSYIKDHPKSFMTPAQIDSQFIAVTSKATCDKVDAQLKAGQPFATVAQTYTLDPDGRQKQNNYRFQYTNEAQMPPPIAKLLDGTPELKDTPWQTLNLGNQVGFIKFFVLKKEKAEPMKITDTIKEVVKRALMTEKGKKAGINIDKLLADKIQAEKGKIQIFDKIDANYWSTVTDQMDKAVAKFNAQGSSLGAVGGTQPGTTGAAAPPAAGAPPAAKTSP